MKTQTAVAVLVAVLAVAVGGAAGESSGVGGKRYLRFNASYAAWVAEGEALDALVVDRSVHFVDVTATEGAGVAQPTAAPSAFVYPPAPKHKQIIDVLAMKLSVASMLANLETFTTFYTRYYTTTTGVQAAQWVYDLAMVYAGGRLGSDITVRYFENSFAQPSVIVQVKGQTDDLVILGAHIDSVGSTATGRSPGADDDGSGTVTVMEVFRVLATENVKPMNTVEFHFYAAEEAGLRGSKAIADAYAKDGKTVVGMLQQDMTGYTGGSSTPTIGMIADYTDPALTAFITKIADTFCPNAIPKESRCGYPCSDHASWTQAAPTDPIAPAFGAGYPAAFAFEATFNEASPYIHSDRDTMATLNSVHLETFARLSLATVIELSLLEPSS